MLYKCFERNYSLFLLNDLFRDIITALSLIIKFLNFIIALVIYIYASNIKRKKGITKTKDYNELLSKNCKFIHILKGKKNF